YQRPIPTRKALLLSGTPSPNAPAELFTSLQYLDPRSWRSFREFVHHYYEDGFEIDEAMRVTGHPRNLDQLQRKLRDTVMIRQMKTEVMRDVPPKQREDVLIDS